MAVLEGAVEMLKARESSGQGSPPGGAKRHKRVALVAQELKLARILAGNNKSGRDRTLRSLQKWFKHRARALPFTEDDFLRIWKGLFYSMWMSDKPLVQEECAENISSLLHSLPAEPSLLFFKCGLQILVNEWNGIDYLRLNKFMMFVRRLLRQGIVVLKDIKWQRDAMDAFCDAISDTVLSPAGSKAVGLLLHFTEIYLEEMAKVTSGMMPLQALTQLLAPFAKKMSVCDDARVINCIRRNVFGFLIRQSDLGIEYEAKFQAWQREGFPGGSIDVMKKIKLNKPSRAESNDTDSVENDESACLHDDEYQQEGILDPRAGHVNVELPQLKFNAKAVAAMMEEFRFSQGSSSKSRKAIVETIEQFRKLTSGIYPLGIKNLKLTDDGQDMSLRKAVNRLVKFDRKTMGGKKGADKKRKRHSDINTAGVNGEDNDGDGGKYEEENEELTVSEVNKKKSRKRRRNQTEMVKEDEKTDDAEDSKKIKKLKHEKELELLSQFSFADFAAKQLQNGMVATSSKKSLKADQRKRKSTADANFSQEQQKLGESYDTPLRKKIRKEAPTLSGMSRQKAFESIFRRNSGTWFVTHNSPERVSESNEKLGDFIERKLSGLKTTPKKSGSPTPTTSHPSPKNEEQQPDGDKPRTSPSYVELFPRSEWDQPTKEGEYEICIPNKRRKQVTVVETMTSEDDVIERTLKTLHSENQVCTDGRKSLDTQLLRNPFSAATPVKRVKINTKLNRSQEFDEHHLQILSSPAIPYDANKKPLRPLLKTSATGSPIDPFYKQANVF